MVILVPKEIDAGFVLDPERLLSSPRTKLPSNSVRGYLSSKFLQLSESSSFAFPLEEQYLQTSDLDLTKSLSLEEEEQQPEQGKGRRRKKCRNRTHAQRRAAKLRRKQEEVARTNFNAVLAELKQ